MNIHEYQAKSLLKSYGVSVPKGGVAFTPQEAHTIAETLRGPWVIKAQIHAGGRGKGGGVKIAQSLEEVGLIASSILGMTLVTPQTGEEGKLVKKIYVEEGCSIHHYVSLLVDRSSSRLMFLASTEKGEWILRRWRLPSSDKIIRTTLDPVSGFQQFQARKLAYGLGLKGDQVKEFTRLAKGLYDTFIQLDASLIEINPLVVTKDGKIFALDAKMSFDDNALYRHPEVVALRDLDEEDPMEYEAFSMIFPISS